MLVLCFEFHTGTRITLPTYSKDSLQSVTCQPGHTRCRADMAATSEPKLDLLRHVSHDGSLCTFERRMWELEELRLAQPAAHSRGDREAVQHSSTSTSMSITVHCMQDDVRLVVSEQNARWCRTLAHALDDTQALQEDDGREDTTNGTAVQGVSCVLPVNHSITSATAQDVFDFASACTAHANATDGKTSLACTSTEAELSPPPAPLKNNAATSHQLRQSCHRHQPLSKRTLAATSHSWWLAPEPDMYTRSGRLLELAKAANFLDFPELLQMVCELLAEKTQQESEDAGLAGEVLGSLGTGDMKVQRYKGIRQRAGVPRALFLWGTHGLFVLHMVSAHGAPSKFLFRQWCSCVSCVATTPCACSCFLPCLEQHGTDMWRYVPGNGVQAHQHDAGRPLPVRAGDFFHGGGALLQTSSASSPHIASYLTTVFPQSYRRK